MTKFTVPLQLSKSATNITNGSRGTANAWRSKFKSTFVTTVVIFLFSVLRCQPLNRALAS
ncbi:acetyltransferase [Vibrio cholerae]|nr:acetyltransferase [Vibrio cholerae]